VKQNFLSQGFEKETFITGGIQMSTPKMTVKEFMKLSNDEQLKVLAQMGFKSLSKAPLKRGVAGKNF
jgi:hypothetical protein